MIVMREENRGQTERFQVLRRTSRLSPAFRPRFSVRSSAALGVRYSQSVDSEASSLGSSL
jgi:hypothetical protein